MKYELDDIRTVLGHKFNSRAEYRLARHQQRIRLYRQGFVEVGKIPDFTEDEGGTMLIMEKPPEDEPKGSGWPTVQERRETTSRGEDR